MSIIWFYDLLLSTWLELNCDWIVNEIKETSKQTIRTWTVWLFVKNSKKKTIWTIWYVFGPKQMGLPSCTVSLYILCGSKRNATFSYSKTILFVCFLFQPLLTELLSFVRKSTTKVGNFPFGCATKNIMTKLFFIV